RRRRGGRCVIWASGGACAPWTARPQPPWTASRRSPRRPYHAAPDPRQRQGQARPAPTPPPTARPSSASAGVWGSAVLGAARSGGRSGGGGLDREAAGPEQIDDAVLADEVQRADDDEPRLGRVEMRFEGVDPALVSADDERIVKLGEALELGRELRAQHVDAAVAPCVDQLVDGVAERLELVERLHDERLLLVGGKPVEDADLLRDRLEPVHGLAVVGGFRQQVALDAAVGADSAPLKPEIEQRDRREPGLETLEQPQLEAERRGECAGALVDVRVEPLLQRCAFRQERRGQ